MNKLLPLFFILFFSVFLHAQQKEIDSLNKLLMRHKALDGARLDILNSLSHHYASVDIKQGLSVSNQAIELAQKLNNKEQLTRAYINKANNYITAGRDSLALKLFYKTIDISNSMVQLDANAKALYGIAKIHQNWSQYETAIDYYNKAYHIFNTIKDN